MMLNTMVLAVVAAGILALALVGLPALGPFSDTAGPQITFAAPFVHDPPGNDWRDLNAEIVTLVNNGDEPVDLTGWSLRNEVMRTYGFPAGTSLAPGALLKIHSGCGSDTESDLYWCSDGPIWDDDTGVATLVASNGRKVDVHAYESLCLPCGDTK